MRFIPQLKSWEFLAWIHINIEKEKRGIVDEICAIQLDSNPHKFQNKSALMVKKNLLQNTTL